MCVCVGRGGGGGGAGNIEQPLYHMAEQLPTSPSD